MAAFSNWVTQMDEIQDFEEKFPISYQELSWISITGLSHI